MVLGADLTDDQFSLLSFMAKQALNLPAGVPREFQVARKGKGHVKLRLPRSKWTDRIPEIDLYELERRNLIKVVERGDRTIRRFYVTSEGLQVAGLGSPDTVIKRKVSLVSNDLPDQYRVARDLVNQAGLRLSEAQDEHGWSEVGHKCREAMQEFAEVLYRNVVPVEQQKILPKDKTVGRIRAVLDSWKPQTGDTTAALLEALLAYWGTVSDLDQKVEHRSQREGRPLCRQDAERAVLYTYLVMAELAAEEQAVTAKQ